MGKLTSLLLLFAFGLNAWAVKYIPPSEKDISDAQKAFKFRGHWISPKIVKEFLPWMSDYDLPLIAALDVGAATGTNRYFGEVDEKGTSASIKEEDGNLVRYEWKGRLSNGMHALVVTESGSGTMVANTLVVFNLSKQTAMDSKGKEYPKLLLEVERIVPLGDRAQSKIGIKDNEIDVEVSCDKTCDAKKFKLIFQ